MLVLGMVFLLVGYAFVYNAIAQWTSPDGTGPSLSESLGLTPGSITLGKTLGSGSSSAPPTGGNQSGQPPSSVPNPPGGTFLNPFPSMGGPFI